jgi:hypothetical protein
MTAYSLYVDQDKILSTLARNRNEAFADFEKNLPGQRLSCEDSDEAIVCYLLDEWTSHHHWTGHTIRVFATPL